MAEREVANVPPLPIPPNPQMRAEPPKAPATGRRSGKEWKLPIASEFVRMVAPALGIYRNLWNLKRRVSLPRSYAGFAVELWRV